MRTFLIALMMTLASQAGADEIDGRMSCKVKTNDIIEIAEGKPTKYLGVENEFEVGDTLTLIYDHFLDVFGLKLYDGLREKDVYSLALGFNEFGINAENNIWVKEYGLGIMTMDRSAKLFVSSNSISGKNLRLGEKLHEQIINLSRCYKNDWQGMLVRKSSFMTQIVTLDCRTTKDQIEKIQAALLYLYLESQRNIDNEG